MAQNEIETQNRKDYARGWLSSSRTLEGTLERADMRGEPAAWYDGYMDEAVGRPKWHTLTCDGVACQEAEHPVRVQS